jgi:uncharacterized protein (TIGR02099 family)
MIHHVTRATRHLIFWSLIIAAIALTGVRLILNGIESYKTNLETRISAEVGIPVKLGRLDAHMRGISPELVIKDINIASLIATEKSTIHLKEIRLGINLGEFLVTQDILTSSWIALVGARFSIIHKQDGQFTVEGLKTGSGEPLWLLHGRQFKVLQSEVTFLDEQKGSAPLVLEAVNLAIMNDGKHHRINMLTNLPSQYGDRLKMAFEFESEAENFSDIKGSLFFQGDNINLHEFVSEYLPYDISISTGSADVKVWSQWQHAKLVSIKADAQMRQTVFSKKGKGAFPIHRLDTQVNWQVKDQQWFVDINRFILESSEVSVKATKKWPDAIVSLAGEMAANAGFHKLKMYAKQLDLAELSKLSQFFSPLTEEQLHWVSQAQVNGILKDFSLYAEPDNKSFAIAGWYDSISAEPFLSFPGIENVSGLVKGGDSLGAVEIISQNVVFKEAHLFGKPILFDRVKGVFAWQQTETEWSLSSQSLELDCPAFKSESRFLVKIPKNKEKPFLDLQIAFNSDDLSQVAAYLPTQIMKDKLANWLTNAFIGGKVSKGDLLLYGNLAGFPFTDKSGVFEAKLEMNKVELNYHPEWGHISGIEGALFFEEDKILGSFDRGLIDKVDINKAEMLISGLGVDELLKIKGQAQGDINQALTILHQSPLARRVDPLVANATIQGNSQMMLDLSIPLRPGHVIEVGGNIQLKNTQLTVNRIGLKVDKINGELKFNKTGIYGDEIQAHALGYPIKISLAQADQNTLLNVAGKAKVSDVESMFDWPITPLLEGEGAYQLQLQIPKIQNDNSPLQVNIKSTLEGVALQFPGTLKKTKAQKKPTSLAITLSDELALPIELDYNNELKAAINFNTKLHKINSGHVLIGNGDVKQTKNSGIKLEVNREQLPLQDWMGLAIAQQAEKNDFNLSEIIIHSQSAFWKKTRLGAFNLGLKRSPNYWSGEIESILAKGAFQLPVDTKTDLPIALDMDMLNLSALKQLKYQDTSSNSDFKPLLNIQSKKTMWQSKNLGELALETARTPQGMTIKRMELKGDEEVLALSGNWKGIGLISSTYINGKLEMKKADQLLDKLNITKDLTDTSGIVDFKLSWDGLPWQPSLPNVRGTMNVSLNSGRILSIEPGFGRLLGILAVAQWVKRLQLDFSDIYEEGLTFNSIKGHFNLLNGKATTDNLVIDAVPAKIAITGDTDLARQTVDYVIKVVPKSLDALPIAGTIVGKVAAMVGKTLTGKDQEGFFFGTQYLVKGGWDDAKISSLHEKDGIIQKTWNSITDFPWSEEKQQ